jgi:hypothetical protein
MPIANKPDFMPRRGYLFVEKIKSNIIVRQLAGYPSVVLRTYGTLLILKWSFYKRVVPMAHFQIYLQHVQK